MAVGSYETYENNFYDSYDTIIHEVSDRFVAAAGEHSRSEQTAIYCEYHEMVD